MEFSSDNNKDKIFKGQQDHEEYDCFFRLHWIDTLKEFLLFTIFIIVISVLIINISNIQEILRGEREMKLIFFMGYLAATFYMHRFFIKMINYFIRVGIITDTRVIDHQKTLFFSDNQDSIDMAQIQNVEKIQQGMLPNLFNYGDIKIYLTASNTAKTFHRVPNAKYHFRCINRYREARQFKLNRLPDRTPQQVQTPPPASTLQPRLNIEETSK